MVDIQHTQARIKNIVALYKELFPKEYAMVIKAVEMQRRIQKDEFGSTHTDGVLKRAILETPETLQTMFLQQLDGDEFTYFKTKEAVRWFALTFPEFSLAEKI